MSTRVLVAFATKTGSTEEVAEEVARILREHELDVDFKPMNSVRNLADYTAVVLGAPLYIFRWHKDARRFLTKHRQTLSKLPVAIFTMGPLNDKEEEWQGARQQIDKELAKHPWLTPVALEVFGGVFVPGKLTFPYTLIPALNQLPPSDLRNWDEIQAWANSLPAQIRSA